MITNLSPRRMARTTLAAFAALSLFALSLGAADARIRSDIETSRGGIKKIIVQEALASRVPPSLALAVAKVESDFQSNALSSKGARGVMQIMPATADGEWGVEADELWDPRLNVRLGIDFLERLIDRYDGNWEFALSYYNGGSKVGKPGQARVLPWTRGYVDSVLRWERRYAQQKRIWLALAEREDAAGRNGPRDPRVRRWLAQDEQADVASTTPEIARAEGELDESVTARKRTTRSRVKWSDTPRRRLAKARQPRKATQRRQAIKRRVRDQDFSNIEERLRAVRGTLDDFTPRIPTPRISEDG